MIVELCVYEEVVDDGRVDDLELRPQRDQDGALHEQREGREGALVRALRGEERQVTFLRNFLRGENITNIKKIMYE